MNEILLGPGSSSRPAPASTGPHHHTAAGAAACHHCLHPWHWSGEAPVCALVTVFRSLHGVTGAALHWAAPVSTLSRQSSSTLAVAAGRAELPATSVTQPHYSYTAPADHCLHEYNIPATSRQSTRRTYMLMEING